MARPFLFQTERGRQILQDSLDSDAESDEDEMPLAQLRQEIREPNRYKPIGWR